MPITTAWANALGDHSIGEADIGALGDTYLALFLANPGDTGSVANEVTGTDYERQLLTGSMSAFVDKLSTNTAEINFGVPGSDWGTIPYVGIMTHVTAGVMRFYQQIPSPRVAMTGGRPVKFSPGSITFTWT